MRTRTLAVLAGILLIAACTDIQSQLSRLDAFVRWNKIGSSSDFWLLKYNLLGEWERVTLVFGFLDDRAFCQDIATLYMQKYPAERYTCEKAN